MEDLLKSRCGTAAYMAPEILNGMQYNYKVDIWSIGALFFELLVGVPPIVGIDEEKLAENIVKGTYLIPE